MNLFCLGHAASLCYEGTVKSGGRVLLSGAVALALACASPPPPTPGALRLAANARAFVEGRVVDRAGRPAAGIGVTAIPRDRDIDWSPPATTDSDGRFVLTLFAPAQYAFFLSHDGRTVITKEKDDPSQVFVAVVPGERRTGVVLVFLAEVWGSV